MLEGRIHSIETCGTVDGPGIRFIVFMQGCLMRCKYCHNRDSWDEDAGEVKTVDQMMEEILPYKHFFRANGGGVTASGGEATLQAEFVTELFKRCKAEGIHTCLDTNGFVKNHNKRIDDLLAVTDLVMLDLKQMQDKTHIDLTKVSNRYAIAFAKHLQDINKPTWARYVVVPGYSDDMPSAKMLADFIAPMKNIERLELLPYHSLGEYKWAEFGEKYELEGISPPSKATMKALELVFKDSGINVIY
ncbi:pyruvate formate lyase 1-activating protein [Thalassotalea aquiviva]|uniref:pyruvate formate lyase 1-activating protein n=1 Tax=Thalassotalea aquiviva TaxID=3242415 RepID=UPI00352A3DA3